MKEPSTYSVLTPKEFDLLVEYLTAVHNDASYDALVLEREQLTEELSALLAQDPASGASISWAKRWMALGDKMRNTSSTCAAEAKEVTLKLYKDFGSRPLEEQHEVKRIAQEAKEVVAQRLGRNLPSVSELSLSMMQWMSSACKAATK